MINEHPGDFNPRPPRGGRPVAQWFNIWHILFQSTPPARGATQVGAYAVRANAISIHAPREGGDIIEALTEQIETISIHAPREGGDMLIRSSCPHHGNISIHAPREGGDTDAGCVRRSGVVFQSTPPARGATHKREKQNKQLVFQSTPPARGATAIAAAMPGKV